MEWIDRMNAAMDYLEEHLTDKIDVSELARIACCSSFHFQRMFSYMAGVPLGEYVRRRRMTRAAEDLCNGARVTDVAARYGYDSPTAFNRAFQSVHGLPPSKARSAALQAYTPIRFSLTVTGGAPLAYRMEALDAFSIVGHAAPIGKTLAENFRAVPALWERMAREEALPGILRMQTGPLPGLLGASRETGEGWQYMIGVCAEEAGEGMALWRVPACHWAVFSGQGAMPTAIQEVERRAVLEWLPASGYEYANAPDIEAYLVPEPENADFEVWLPVVRP